MGPYPVADELRAFGFEWFDPDDSTGLDRFLSAPDDAMLERNRRIEDIRMRPPDDPDGDRASDECSEFTLHGLRTEGLKDEG